MKLADISIKRPVFASVLVSVLLVFGLLAYPRIGVDLFPEVEFPIVTITAVYPGADPETIETKVIDKIEEAVNSVNGIKILRSTSQENIGVVFVQFELERRADQAVQDVRDKVGAVQRLLPDEVEPPVIEKFDVGATPILTISASSTGSVAELTTIAEDMIKERLQTIPGIGGIDIVGGQRREFHVFVDSKKLEGHGLVVGDVVAALRSQNIELPAGRLNLNKREFVVKTMGQVRDVSGIGNLILSSHDGAVLRVKDVATIEDGTEEQRSHSDVNGKSAVALVLKKQSGSNTVDVAKRVKASLLDIEKTLPPHIKIALPSDSSTFIEHSINDVKFDLVFGAVLAIVIIFFFLFDLRATLISSLALPTSVIATFAFIQYMGFTFNNMSMLALSLSIGILIDDAIVVIESIHRHMAMGKPPMTAASDACKEIGLAVMATTASIIAVFLPVGTMKGMIGRFFFQFGLTVAFSVAVSLFVAFTLTPMLSARFLRVSHGGEHHWWLQRIILNLLGKLDGLYQRILAWALRHRLVTMLIAVVILVASFGMAKFIPFEFLPPEDRAQFMVRVELPVGTDLQTTLVKIDEARKLLSTMPGVQLCLTTIGGGSQGEVNKGDIFVSLVPKGQRTFTQEEGMHYARSLFANAKNKGMQVSVERINAVGGNNSGFRSAMVQFNLQGRDYAELNNVADKIIAQMRKAGGYVDIDTTFRGGKPELSVIVDRDKAADLGVPMAVIASTLRTLIDGEQAGEVATDGDRFDIRLRLDEKQRQNAASLLAIKVRSSSGVLIPLGSFMRIDAGTGPAKIERQNRQRQVTIFSNLQGKPLGDAVQEIEGFAKAAAPVTVQTSWAGMGDVMKESMGNLAIALLLAVILIYLILAAQFESFLHPFTIMLSLPFSLIGAFGGLLISGMTMNIFTMIGVIMLMGLVTKNAILLVDYANTLRRGGDKKDAALLKAGVVRLRPILMTTAAMVFGMIPVALALSEGGEQRAPMAVTVIGGLITSTMLTLLVVPVAYSLLEQLAGWTARVVFRRKTVSQAS